MTLTTPTVPSASVDARPDNRMFIKLRDNIVVTGGSSETYRQRVNEHKGQWVEVDTEHLFTNQYNTCASVLSSGEMHIGVRLFDTDIEAVRNDARIGKGKCKYCGTMVTTGQECNKHNECSSYGIEWFTEKNTFFLRYPTIPDIEINNVGQVKVGTYTLEYQDYDKCFRLANMRKTIRFKYINGEYIIHDGIGFIRRRFLDIPPSLTVKIKQALNKFITTK